MGDMARRLRTGGDTEEEQGGEVGGGGEREGEGRLCEAIPGVYFRQYLPTSNKVCSHSRTLALPVCALIRERCHVAGTV